MLAGVVGTGDGTNVAVGQRDGVERLAQGAGNGANLELGLGEGRVIELNTTEVSPKKSKSLASHAVIEILKLVLVLGRHTRSIGLVFALGRDP